MKIFFVIYDQKIKGSVNRLKYFEPVKHIKLLLRMFQNIFNNSLMGSKTWFFEFKNKKLDRGQEEEEDPKGSAIRLKIFVVINHKIL